MVVLSTKKSGTGRAAEEPEVVVLPAKKSVATESLDDAVVLTNADGVKLTRKYNDYHVDPSEYSRLSNDQLIAEYNSLMDDMCDSRFMFATNKYTRDFTDELNQISSILQRRGVGLILGGKDSRILGTVGSATETSTGAPLRPSNQGENYAPWSQQNNFLQQQALQDDINAAALWQQQDLLNGGNGFLDDALGGAADDFFPY